MKQINFRWLFVIILILFLAIHLIESKAFGQDYYGWDMGRTIIDSTTWLLDNVEQEGENNCEHDWANSGAYDPKPTMGCLVLHGCGSTCDWHWPREDKICRKCGRIEHWRSIVHSHCEESEASKKRRDYQDELGRWKPSPQPYWINDSTISFTIDTSTIQWPQGIMVIDSLTIDSNYYFQDWDIDYPWNVDTTTLEYKDTDYGVQNTPVPYTPGMSIPPGGTVIVTIDPSLGIRPTKEEEK